MKSLRNLGRTRLAQGTAAGIYGLGIQLAVQLVSVPVLTHSWGLAGYGVWVLLYSVPALLAMADLGLTSAGTSAMTSAVAKGDHARAARIMMALRVITVIAGLVLLGVAIAAALLIFPHALDFGAALPLHEARLTALALALYGFLALVNGVTIAGFVATDKFAASGFIYQTASPAPPGRWCGPCSPAGPRRRSTPGDGWCCFRSEPRLRLAPGSMPASRCGCRPTSSSAAIA